MFIWVKVFKNGPSKICGKQPFKKFEVLWSAQAQYLDQCNESQFNCNALLCFRCAHVFDESFQLFREKKRKLFTLF